MSTNEAKVVSSSTLEAEISEIEANKTNKSNNQQTKSVLNSSTEMDSSPSGPQTNNNSANQGHSNKNNKNNKQQQHYHHNHNQQQSVNKSQDFYPLHDVYVPNYSHPGLKFPNTYLDPNNLTLMAKQYLSQLNASNQSLSQSKPNLMQQASTIRSSHDPLPTNNNNNNNKKQANRNSSCNPFNKPNMYKSTHEFVTLEFSNPMMNGMPPKYVSRERKPLAIVNPVTKQVVNASQINSARSSSISTSQSSPIDLKYIDQAVQANGGVPPQANKPFYQNSPHVGRRDLNKTNSAQNFQKHTTDNSATTFKTSTIFKEPFFFLLYVRLLIYITTHRNRIETEFL